MDREKIIHNWQEKRRDVTIPEDFSAGVMAAIEARKVEPAHEILFDGIKFSNRLFQWATASGLALLGLFRILYIVANLCQPHMVIP